MLTLGAGRKTDLVAPYSSQTLDLSHMMLHLPRVAPIRNTNPGYTILEFEKSELKEVRFRHF